MASRLLLVDDDPHTSHALSANLVAAGYQVEVAIDGWQAMAKVREEEFGMVILDVVLPGKDGFTVCERIRAEGHDTPVLFVSARAGVYDRIRGLEVGGDDYLAKPVQPRELLLRIAAILRRRARYDEVTAREPVLRFGGNTLDYGALRARAANGVEHLLTQKEAMILKVLAERAGEVLWRDEIVDKVWGNEVLPSSRTIDTYIGQLRRRFEVDPDAPRFIHTVRGVGYRFTTTPEAAP